MLRLGPLDLLLFGLISNRGMAVVLAAFGLCWEFGLFDHVEDLAKDVDLPDESLWDLLPLPLVVFTALLLMILFMRALSVFWAFWKLHGFTLTRAGDDLQTRCGLFTRLTATIPRARIQAVTVRETLLHRWAGRVAVKVDTAGGSVLENSAATRSWVAPLVPIEQLDDLLDHLQPGLALSDVTWRPVHPRAVRRLCKRRLVGISLLVLPLAIWFSTWSLAAWPVLAALAVWDARQRVPWMGFAVDELSLVVRTGLWTRQTRAVRHTKIQVIHQAESPFDRRWGMRTLGVDAAGSLSRTQLPYLTSESALELGDLLASRAGRHAFRW